MKVSYPGDDYPLIPISAKVLKSLVAHLEKRDDSRRIRKVPYALACFRKLRTEHAFSFSIEIGPKTVNLTANLNPRSQ